MAKIIDTSTIDPKKLKRSVFFCNLFIACVCVIAIAALIMGNFLTIKVSVELDEKLISNVTQGTVSTQAAENGSTQTTPDISELISKIPLKDRTVGLDISLSSNVLMGTVTAGNDAIVKSIFNEQVNRIVLQLVPIVKVVAKAAVNVAMLQAVDYVKQTLMEEQGITQDELENKLKEMGIDSDQIMTDTNRVIDELFSENPNTEEIKSDAVDIIGNIMSSQGEDVKQQAIDEFSKVFDQLVQEGTDANGNFSTDALLNKLLETIKNQGATASVPAAKFMGSTVLTAGVDTDLSAQVTDLLMQNIPSGVTANIGLIGRILGIVMLVIIAAWAYVLLKLIIKMFAARNKTVRMGMACFFGMLMYIILVIVPFVLLQFVVPNVWQGTIPAGVVISTASNAFLVSFICAWVLIVFWFFYKKYRKRSKALIREDELSRSIF